MTDTQHGDFVNNERIERAQRTPAEGMAELLARELRRLRARAFTVAATPIDARTSIAVVEGRHIEGLRDALGKDDGSALTLYDQWVEANS